ncbi:hypothetical protein A3218_21825 [Pseudomonas chlororaphis]|nr:hypothetical protein A3218_21825 [Pseudomonas chlororaphis]
MAKLLQRRFRLPAQALLGERGITDQQFHFCRSVETRVNFDSSHTCPTVDTKLALPTFTPVNINTDSLETHGDKVTNGFSAICSQYKSFRSIDLQHAVHAIYVLFGKTPITLGIHIAEFQNLLSTYFNISYRVGNFSSNEFFTSQWGFMIKQNTAGSEDTIRLPIVYRSPMSEQLRHSIRAPRIKRGTFGLGNSLNQSKHLRSRCLIITYLGVHDPNCFKQIKRTNTSNLSRSDRLIKRNTNKTLGCEVIHLIRFAVFNQTNSPSQIGQVKLDKMQAIMVQDT